MTAHISLLALMNVDNSLRNVGKLNCISNYVIATKMSNLPHV